LYVKKSKITEFIDPRELFLYKLFELLKLGPKVWFS